MARMTFSGTEEIMEELFRESERLERKATEMLNAAGEVVTKAWKDAIDEHGHVLTGDMKNSVRPTPVRKKGDAYVVYVYPHGSDRKSQSNADKAFYLHYGNSKIKGDHFVDDAEGKAEELAGAAMEAIWTRD